jgi:uncharacterized protein with von Willebrand factor type A (vWA) domain
VERAFANFLKALRGAEVRVSVAETLDAMRVMDLVGWSDREALKTSLSFALAKSAPEKETFDACFDDFYRSDSFNARQEADEPKQAPGRASASRLGQLLLADDQAALSMAMQQAAAEIGVENIRIYTQRMIYAHRIMRHMGLRELDAELSALDQAEADGGAGSGGGTGGGGNVPGSAASARQRLEQRRAYLLDQVRDFVNQQLMLHGAATIKDLKEDRLRRTRIGNMSRRDQEDMRKIVDRIAKRLLALYSRKRKLRDRGVIDVRQTMRHNYGNDGILFELKWRRRKIDRAKVVAICDVSGSVAQVSRFLLQFLYALHEVLTDIRTFAFSGQLIETSGFFERMPVEGAVAEIMDRVGNMSTDYGQSLLDFRGGWLDQLDKRTTVVILGDARSNRSEPRADIMKEIFERSKRVIWLNPESRAQWGSGDSEQWRYAPYCHLVRECNTLNHLERLIEDLLQSARRVR